MGKKTLKQKKRADEKRLHPAHHPVSHPVEQQTPNVPTYTFSSPSIKQTHHPHMAPTAQPPIAFVAHDLRKTLILSLVIVACEIILYTLLHSHILALPFIRY